MRRRGRRPRLESLSPALPDAEVGAPLPVAVATEHDVFVAYFGGTEVQERLDERDAVVSLRFFGAYASTLGPPNDEAFDGHPLAASGLRPYEFTTVVDSPWINRVERMNRVHPHHTREPFDLLKHFILPFHDTTFECLARGVEVVDVKSGTPAAVLADLLRPAE